MQDRIDAGRRKLIQAAGRSALAVAGGLLTPATLLAPRHAAAQTQAPHQNIDHTIRIADRRRRPSIGKNSKKPSAYCAGMRRAGRAK